MNHKNKKNELPSRRRFISRAMTASAFCCLYKPQEENTDERIIAEKKFIENWLQDLMDTMDAELNEETKIRLMNGCGRGCYKRHTFKQDIAREGKGDVDKLIAAMKKNFEIWRDGDDVHIRYGEISETCYCPVLHDYPSRPNDMHCYCTRATHQTIFEEALERPVRVDIVETLRRGGKTCHFVAHLG